MLPESFMFERCCSHIHHSLGHYIPAALAALLLLPIAATAQESRQAIVNSGPLTVLRTADAVPGGARLLTLADARQLAQAASDPLKRLGELQVEAARQHRLGVT